MHRLLKRQIERLGLNPAAAPNVPLWKQFLDRVDATYAQSDEARHLSERSMDLSSREMHELHERIRKSNEQLEEHVRERTSELARAERAARDSEARFRSLTELSSDWYWAQDEDMRFIEVSGHNASAAGEGAPHRYIGRTRWETGLEILGTTWEEHRKMLGARRPFRDQQFRRRHPDGAVTYIAVSGEPSYDAAGAFKGYRGVGRDITDRKRNEQLRELEHTVARSMAEADSASAALKGAIRAICESEGWDCGRCLQLDARAGVMRFAEDWNAPSVNAERYVAESRPVVYRPSDGLVGVVWQSGRPLWVPDTTKDPRVFRKRAARDTGLHGAIYFPVLAEGKTIGILGFNSREVREPDEKLMQAVGAIGSRIGQFLQRKQAEQVLRESEERFRAIFEQAGVGITRVDLDGVLVDVNQKFCDMLGYAKEELLGRAVRDITHPDDYGRGSHYRAELARGSAGSMASEKRFLRKDGTVMWARRTMSSSRDAAGNPQHVISVVEDITERKELERRFELAFNQAAVGMTQSSLEGRLLQVNQKYADMLGYAREELLGMRIEELTHPEDRLETLEAMQQLRDRQIERASGEKRLVRKDGRVIWVNRTSALVRVESGEPLHYIAVIEDITERKQAEERYRATFDNAPVGIMHTGIDDDRILHANAKLSEMLGYTYDELVCMKIDQFIHPDYVGADQPKYRDQMMKGELETFSSERLYRRKDGSDLWVNRTVSLVRDLAGSPLYFIRIIEDITERTQSARRRAMEHAVTQVLAESATVAQAMPVILRNICQALGWTCGAYWKWNEAEELLHCADTWHVDAEGVAEFVAATREKPNEAPAWRGAAPGTITGGVVRRVWFGGVPVWFPDVTLQPDFRRGPIAARANLRSAFGFPILAGTQPLGVMEFYSREIEQPDDALLQMVRAVGSQIGQFIQRKQAEDKVAHLAQFDTVTGLPNRYLFNDRLDVMLTQAQRNQWSLGILFVDLDRFKAVNDTLGHAAGDLLLRLVAARLRECVRPSDIVGRLSGDEFALVLADLAKVDDAGLVAQKIVGALAAPFDLGGHQTYISASIGIALFPNDGRDAATLVRNADTAMYRAKEQGRNGYRFYLPDMNERLQKRLEREAQLRGALERDEYRLHYQPKVSLQSGAISGFEALLRWEHGGRLVPPAEFIPILEYTGLIVPVGEWVVRSVCQQIKRWEKQRLAVQPVAVNLSARQFQRTNLVEAVGRIVKETGVAPGLLELELTETLLMSDAEEAVETLRKLKALGVRLAVDDFGTGYSSLAYLKRFPLDALKIDRTFVRDAVTDPDDATITLTIINLAHSLKLKVIAEGVETEGQLHFLRSHGCDEMQGFYFSRPLPVEDSTRALAEGRRLQVTQADKPADTLSVLLVDDDEDALQVLRRALAAGGFHVLTATSGRAGLELLARHGAEIVISDHGMPEMTGIEFLTSVRKLYPNTLRLLTSDDDDAPTLTRATNRAGIHSFLSKTWNEERLRTEVREAYRQRS